MRRWMILAAVFLTVGCRGKAASDPKGAVGSQTVLAQVDDMVITSADMKEVLARYSNQPFVLARYSSLEKKKELLDSLIRYDVLAIEARKKGYERDPEVQRVAKDRMVKLFTQQEINDKTKLSDISDDEVQRYYKEHATDYARPETVRVSQILVKDRAKAATVLAVAKALPKSDLKAFRDLVAKESEDADSKQRGGDLTQFDRATPHVPPPVVNAAFALKEVGDVSDLVATDKGFVVLKLTERRVALSRSFEDAKPEIQKRLLEDLRARKKREFIEEARKAVRVEIFEDSLAKLDLAAALSAPAQPAALDAGPVLGNKP